MLNNLLSFMLNSIKYLKDFKIDTFFSINIFDTEKGPFAEMVKSVCT